MGKYIKAGAICAFIFMAIVTAPVQASLIGDDIDVDYEGNLGGAHEIFLITELPTEWEFGLGISNDVTGGASESISATIGDGTLTI